MPCRNVVAHGTDRRRCRRPQFRPSRGPPPPVSPENEFPHHPLCFPHLTMISRALECQQRKASAVTTSTSSASTLLPEGTAATRHRSLSPSQEVPVRALHVPRSARAIAASPSALGEIPMPRAFRFAASGRFPWSVERSRVVVESSGHTFMESAFIMFWSCSLPSRGRRRLVSPWI